MARLNFWTTTPSGGWRFFEFRTRAVLRSDNGDDLVREIIAHRQYKGLEPTDAPTVRLEVERQACARLSRRDCTAEGIDDEWVPIDDRALNNFSLSTIMEVSNVMFDIIKNGEAAMVPMHEVERRRDICSRCPLNAHATGCISCSLLYSTVNLVIPASRKFEDMHVCGACGCSLSAKLQVPLDKLKQIDASREIQYPKWCWMNEEPANSLQS